MKGIILAGGAGSRLYPLTQVASKQLQPVYDKPMVYYPLSTLLENGIREIALISTPQDLPRFMEFLGDGSQWGACITYLEQPRPEGIAQAFIIADKFIDRESVALILGDNIFYGAGQFEEAFKEHGTGATIFAYKVNDPARYGVVEIDNSGRAISIEEKPKLPKSSYAVPGFYLFDSSVCQLAEKLRPSARGELEIADVMADYMKQGTLEVRVLRRGVAWLDSGTSQSLHEAAAFVQTMEKRQGIKIGCPEEAALTAGLISLDEFDTRIQYLPECEYKDYLSGISIEKHRFIPSKPY
tara:strand:+ start:635 stop:1525 length:891 start_codon:yes stop_codon:yes gene_type:complete